MQGSSSTILFSLWKELIEWSRRRSESRFAVVDLSTSRPLISDLYDTDSFPQTPEGMWHQLEDESERKPYEMTYSHVSCEEVHKFYWTGIKRDWDRVQYMMDRDTQVMQRNN